MSQTKLLSNEYLKSLMQDAMLFRGECTDINADLLPGIYTPTSTCMGTLPPNLGNQLQYGLLIVFPKRGINKRYQMGIGENGKFAVRSSGDNGNWQSWWCPTLTTTP